MLHFQKLTSGNPDKFNQSKATLLQQKINTAYQKILKENTDQNNQFHAKAEELVKECLEMYQNMVKQNMSTDDNLRTVHETAYKRTCKHFKAGCPVSSTSFVDTYISKITAQTEDIFKEVEEAQNLERREQEIEVKEITADARKIYHDEMVKRVSAESSQEFMDTSKLLRLHESCSGTAVARILARNPHLNDNQKKMLEKSLETSFVKYKDENFMKFNFEKDVEPAIGIDLGTTYCCTGVFFNNKVQIIRSRDGGNTTPSYVAFHDDGSRVIGKSAKDNAYRNPEGSIFDVKRMIGRKFEDEVLQKDMKFWPFNVVRKGKVPAIQVRDKTYHPEQISAFLLKQLKEEAEEILRRKISKAVITVPAYFNDGQRQATVDAGRMAGLQVLTILNEPTAAAIAYKHLRFQEDAKHVLIFDLGGGTFDVAVLRMDANEIKVLGVDGDTHLGGEDFDQNLMEYCANQFKMRTGVDLLYRKDASSKTIRDECRQRLRRLKTEYEHAKVALSRRGYFDVSIAKLVDNYDLNVTVTKDGFERMNDDFFKRALNIMDKAIRAVNLRKEDIDDIVLIGGSTRIPQVQKMLTEQFGGRALSHEINSDEAVAYGAAIHAAILNGVEARGGTTFAKIQDVTPLSLGVEVASGELSVILRKNTPVPTKHDEMYVTKHDYQRSVQVNIYQGENLRVASQNTLLGEFTLSGIPPARAGVEEINVQMEINAMGILRVTARSISTNATQSLDIDERKNRLSEREILQFGQEINRPVQPRMTYFSTFSSQMQPNYFA